MARSTLKYVLGGSHIFNWSPEDTAAYREVMNKHGITDIDTSRIYERSEEVIGSLPNREALHVHTKTGGFTKGALSKQSILDSAHASLSHLKHIETYMFQSPDPSTPIEESLSAIASLHASGHIHDLCSSKGYVLPTVYTGPYNAVTRRNETELLPILRRLGISYWAYSPIGAGFLTKRFEDFNLPGNEGFGTGRFSREVEWMAGIVNQLYNRPKLLEALKLWNEVAREEGVAPAELAARWIAYHSALEAGRGDAVILGSSRPLQLDQTLETIKKGPLSQRAVEGVEKVWSVAKEDAQTGEPLFA
ncbi:Pyridoxal reductase [Elsinoe australis]|uniref:Pyridoxal reductase n=1 Tax=Elsinoe australis TaxID=40998 RepID=A0A2P7ZZY9_9PEZI|nr:Pyridoxal reductase [Elsinoe australis]